MRLIKFPQQNCILGANQPEYLPLPACRVGDEEGMVISCWRLSWWERMKVLSGFRNSLSTSRFSHSYQWSIARFSNAISLPPNWTYGDSQYRGF